MTQTAFPIMYRVQQAFESHALPRPEEELRRQLLHSRTIRGLKPGAQVAVVVGSRGIANLSVFVATIVDVLRERGCEPFIVPAIGSQGGGTPEGQEAVLAALGIVQRNVGCPVKSSATVIRVGVTPSGVPIYCDELACNSDAIVLINRVKPHTAFRGDIESGLMKMLAVGLGKRESAEAVHASPLGLAAAIVETARALTRHVPVRLGVAITEDAYDKTAEVCVVEPSQFEETEKRLLKSARAMLPRLPFDHLDVLIVEQMGKNISGAGMDPNVIGMGRRIPELVDSRPVIGLVAALDLTAESQGNAEGVGLADVVTERLVRKIDLMTTHLNCSTSRFSRGGVIPVAVPTDRAAFELALAGHSPSEVRLVQIKNTLALSSLRVSAALLSEVRSRSHLSVESEIGLPQFDREGNLL